MMIEATWSTNEVCVRNKGRHTCCRMFSMDRVGHIHDNVSIDDALTKGIKPYALCQAESG